MKKIIYILVSAAMLAGTAGCAKQPFPEKDSETMTISIVPEFEMDIDVKSVEIGKTDIWCFVYDFDTMEQVEGSPVKQNEINGNVYSYQVPKCVNAQVHFAIMPENTTWKELYSTHYNNYIDCNDSFVTTTETELYMSNGEWSSTGSYGIYVNSADSGTDTYPVTMQQRHRKTHVMFRVTNLPDGVTTESLIKNIHITMGGISLDKVLTPADMTKEYTASENTTYEWLTADIYNYFGYDYREANSNYNEFTFTIETTDNRIFKSDEFYTNFEPNEAMEIVIDYYYIMKADK
ncbi:MAG: hypothetical protein IJ394_07755 [Bacteroidales bacterium]|nr:hypothetical protein [Bacteroidales bacterium]